MTLGRLIGRSIGATLALAFGATMLAVFALVGTYVYTALERQVSTQDDLDIVLAARHTRRLAGELDSLDAVRTMKPVPGGRIDSTISRKRRRSLSEPMRREMPM